MEIVLSCILVICIIIASYYAYRYRLLFHKGYKELLKDIERFEKETQLLELQAVTLRLKIDDAEKEYFAEKEKYARYYQKNEDDMVHYEKLLQLRKNLALKEATDEMDKAYNKLLEFQKLCKDKEEDIQNELTELTNTLLARLEATRREQEIKENKDKYCLTLSLAEENDIRTLSDIKSKLHNPRILNMLIWQTYFQKPLTTLCNKLIGLKAKSGIYKITNQITNECYIGLAVDLASRWKEHAKCGLGIDTPDGNKLYKNMIEYGLLNFSWEVLEECNKDKLDEKEAYYIDAYLSKDFGLNTLAGRNVKKK